MSDHDAGSVASSSGRFDAASIERPDRSLLTYYLICAALTGPAFFILVLPFYFKYETLRYRFDADGVSMTWGILFRREIYLTYRRIQDIHVTRNILQRWMGLATVAVQTASGTAGAEMSIEGVLAFDGLRDFLYQKMRGAKGIAEHEAHGAAISGSLPMGAGGGPGNGRGGKGPAGEGGAGGSLSDPAFAQPPDEALVLLREIRDALTQRSKA